MLKWCAIYQDDPQKEVCIEEPAPRDAVLKRFGLGMHGGRAVVGMWLIDGATEQDDVIAIYGHVPVPIQIRYAA
jgi:hypothetical protein